jgi:hypothetical protein
MSRPVTSDMALRARIAANTRWAKEPDRAAATRPARDAMRAKFVRMVDPEGKITDPVELERRVASARKAHYLALARKSAEARRRRRSP